MAVLKVEGVAFSYAERQVLVDVSFEAKAGESLVILGPSGSGKSTLLRVLAGLDAPHAGTIFLNGELASSAERVDLEPAARGLSLVFQELALWPHMTCDAQLAFAAPALGGGERGALLESVGLAGFSDRLPGGMSGGERQRLALARALAPKPRVVLLDEPFASLDPALRIELRRLLLGLRGPDGAAFVYVTHDQEDAFALADRCAVLNRGKLEQVDAPEALYRHPANAFVATFVGKAAIVPGTVQGETIRTVIGAVPNERAELRDGLEVDVAIRPEDVEASREGVEAEVVETVFTAGRYLARAVAAATSFYLYLPSAPHGGRGRTIAVRARRGWPIVR